jgi:glutathione synthase/RimK-type ligase-like ATP-grasp enzyme
VYRADKVADGTDTLTLGVQQSSEFILKYCGEVHRINEIPAAWFRHPNILCLDYQDKATQMSIEKEITALQESIWQLFPDYIWLNNPNTMKAAQAKLAQLSLASEFGFNIPKTLVSNDWSEIDEAFIDDDIAVKMSSGVVIRSNKSHVLYTSRLKNSQRDSMQSKNPFPAIYQPFLDKKREWRVTVVGDRVFSSSIYCAEDADTDWRRYQLTDKVEFKDELLPDIETEKCISFLRHLGLVYGAFDFIENHDGKITFLECNTNGQYKWLEESLGFPISSAIADELILIHNRNS